MSNYQELLQQLGLSAKESAIYLALLELGKADVSDIARVAGIKRPTAYFVLKDLEQKRFVSAVSSGKIQQFIAEDPQKILALEKSKLVELEALMPGLLGLKSKNVYKPGTRFFTGQDGIRSVYEESLLQPTGSEMLAIGNAQAVEESIPGFGDWYIKRRVQNGIKMRALTPATPGGLSVKKRDAAELRLTKLLPPDQFTQPVEINIYGNKVSAVSLVENELVGIIVESKVLAAAQKQLFEILWNSVA